MVETNGRSEASLVVETIDRLKHQLDASEASRKSLATKLARLKLLALETLCECPMPQQSVRREISLDCPVHKRSSDGLLQELARL